MIENINIKKEKLSQCPICQSDNFSDNLVVGKGYQYGINENTSYSQCANCNVLFQNPRIPQKNISHYYQNNYYTHKKNLGKSNENILREKIKSLKWKWISIFNYRFPKTKGAFLDYGAGSGSFLNILHGQGWNDLWGYDPDDQPFVCEKESVQRIYEEDIFPLKNELKNKFKYILTHHSVEHISDPLPIMKLWYQALEKNGELILATPNVNSLSFKIFKGFWYFLTPPHHYIIYSPKALKISLEKVGFKINSIEYHSSAQCFWGSLDFMTQSNKITKNKKINMNLNNFKLLGILSMPLIFILDMFSLGDNIVVKAKKIEN